MYSKGKWEVTKIGDCWNVKEKAIIANIAFNKGDSCYGIIASVPTNSVTFRQALGNAKLIAAAPELLEACEKAEYELSGFLGCCGKDEKRDSFQGFVIACEKAQAAIAAAT